MKLKFGDWILVPSNYFDEDHYMELGPSKDIGKIISALGSIIPKLENRVTHYNVINRVTNSTILIFLIFRVRNSI